MGTVRNKVTTRRKSRNQDVKCSWSATLNIHDFWFHRIKFWPSETNGKTSAAVEQEFIQNSDDSWVCINRQIDYIFIFQTQIKKLSPVSASCFLKQCINWIVGVHITLWITCVCERWQIEAALSIEDHCLVQKTLKLDANQNLWV